MEAFWEMHRDGGSYVLIISSLNILAICLLVVVVVFALKQREGKWFGFSLLFCAVGNIALGLWAYHLGMAAALSAIALADPELKSMLLEESRIYAMIPFNYGLVSSLLWGILGVVAVLYFKRVRNKKEVASGELS